MSNDFLNVETPSAGMTPEQMKVKELEFAQLYVEAFVHNPAGRQILAMWDTQLRNHRTPTNATLNEYVFVEARRRFIQDIYGQIKLAQQRGL